MKIKTTILDNGSRLIVIKTPNFYSVTLMALLFSGPVFDPLNKNGISHCIEHLLFKGSKKYPSNEVLSRKLEKHGAIMEAFSYQETNAYWIKVIKDRLDVAVDILTQQIQNPLFRNEDIIYEKNIIKNELSLVKSNPSLLIWELWSQTIWENSQLGRIYTGEEEDIDSFLRKDILQFFKKRYTADNTVFVVCGNITVEKSKKLLNNSLLNYNRRLKSKAILVKNKGKSNIKIINDKSTNLTVMYGFLTTNRFSEDVYVLELIDYIVGRGQGSLLNQNIANKGLTYSIYSSTKHLSSTGYFSVNFTCNKDDLNKILKLINIQLDLIKNGEISDVQIERAKGYFVGQLMIQNDTTDSLASWFGYQAVNNDKKLLIPKDKQKLIKKISKEDIIKVAKKYLDKNKYYLSIIGSIKKRDICF
jgi:predicted Zn-dependent peptidase